MARHSNMPSPPSRESELVAKAKRFLGAVVALGFVSSCFLWMTWRTFFKYVEPGEMLVLKANFGKDLQPGQILAKPGQMGVQEEVLGEGRHFVMPVVYEYEIVKCLDIPPGHVGVVTARSGKDPATGKILVDKGEKGVWKDVLPPGRYRLNPQGYKVEVRPAVVIRAGFAGFVTSLVGAEPKGAFAEDGEKGMRHDVLEPGIYYLNPYAVRVQEMEVGINQVSFLDEHVIAFPSSDAFEIKLESTVEWELHPEAVAQVAAEFGVQSSTIEEKVIVPQSKSIGRLAGSRYGAKDFLLGEGREKFQQAFTEELVRICKEKHLDIHSAFIRHILIPANLLKPIQEAFVSIEKQKTAKFWEETKKSAADLEREQALLIQRQQEVTAQTGALVMKIEAEASQEVGKIEAETRRQIAAKQQEIAQLDAERTRALGVAKAEVTKRTGDARASLFGLKVKAFQGDAEAFRRHTFAEELPQDFSMRLVQSGPGTFWTDLLGTAGADDLVKLKLLKDGQRK